MCSLVRRAGSSDRPEEFLRPNRDTVHAISHASMNLIRALSPAIIAAAALIRSQQLPTSLPAPPDMSVPAGAASVEQTVAGARDAALLVESFDGLGVGFEGPQGTGDAAQSVGQQPRRRTRSHRRRS